MAPVVIPPVTTKMSRMFSVIMFLEPHQIAFYRTSTKGQGGNEPNGQQKLKGKNPEWLSPALDSGLPFLWSASLDRLYGGIVLGSRRWGALARFQFKGFKPA